MQNFTGIRVFFHSSIFYTAHECIHGPGRAGGDPDVEGHVRQCVSSSSQRTASCPFTSSRSISPSHRRAPCSSFKPFTSQVSAHYFIHYSQAANVANSTS